MKRLDPIRQWRSSKVASVRPGRHSPCQGLTEGSAKRCETQVDSVELKHKFEELHAGLHMAKSLTLIELIVPDRKGLVSEIGAMAVSCNKLPQQLCPDKHAVREWGGAE